MKYFFWIFSVFLITVFYNKESNSQSESSQELTEKLLDPIAVDSFAEPTYFKTIQLFKDEIVMKVPASGYKTYFNNGLGSDYMINEKDTLYLEYEVAFTKSNLIQKIENHESKDEYFYDDKNNLVLRQLVAKRKDKSSRFHWFIYDKYGNLKSSYSYSIEFNGKYEFDYYKEYNYTKDKTGITVMVKGVEGSSNYHKLNIIKKFDNEGRIISESYQDYYPLSKKEFTTIKEYKHVEINGKNYVSKQKMYMSNKPDETITVLYEYNTEGKEIVVNNIQNTSKYNLEYKIRKEYAGNNLKQSVSSAVSNLESRVADVYPAKKSGLQETFTYTYNEQNNVIKQEHTIHSGLKEDYDVTTNVYEYDANGNWNYMNQTKKYPYLKDSDDESNYSLYIRKLDYSQNNEAPATPKPDPKAEKLKKEVLQQYPLQ